MQGALASNVAKGPKSRRLRNQKPGISQGLERRPDLRFAEPAVGQGPSCRVPSLGRLAASEALDLAFQVIAAVESGADDFGQTPKFIVCARFLEVFGNFAKIGEVLLRGEKDGLGHGTPRYDRTARSAMGCFSDWHKGLTHRSRSPSAAPHSSLPRTRFEHLKSLERLLRSPKVAPEAAWLKRGVAMFHSDPVYFRENVKALKALLEVQKTSHADAPERSRRPRAPKTRRSTK